MFEILFSKWENLADAHIAYWILIVQSDTLLVVGVPRQWLSGGVGGGTPLFSFIFRFGALFLVKNFRKVIRLGVWRFVDFFFFFWGGGGGGHYEIGLFFWGGSFLYILGLFKVKIQNGNIFSAAKFQIFLGMPEGPNWEYLLECLWVQIYTSTLALYGGLGIRMLQMTRLEAQFDNTYHN